MAGSKLVAILVPVHNGLEFTKQAMRKLFEGVTNAQGGGTEFKVLVIDDGSNDGTAGWVSEKYPNVTLLFGDGNLWWSGAINMGARFAFSEMNADYVLLWNNDIAPEMQYFSNLRRLIGMHEGKKILASKIYFMHKPDVIWHMGGIFEARTGRKYVIGYNQKDCARYAVDQSCDWATGMGTAVPRQVIEAIGYWDAKRFPQYLGDCDFTRRATEAGYEIIGCADLKIWNDIRQTGLGHNDSFERLLTSFFDLRSNFNLEKDVLFYREHAETFVSYYGLLEKYGGYIGGFLKWKIMGILGKRRQE